MAEILRQGEEDIKNGRGTVVKIEDLWKLAPSFVAKNKI